MGEEEEDIMGDTRIVLTKKEHLDDQRTNKRQDRQTLSSASAAPMS